MKVGEDLLTFSQFERMPDPSSGHYELRHGQLVHMPPSKKLHVQIQQALFDLISPLARGRGFLAVEFPFRPEREYEYRVADLAFISRDRWERDDGDYFAGAPDLVIEVLSESNTMDEMLDRQEVCLRNGCASFWTVDPKRRTVMVTTQNGVTLRLSEGSMAPLPPPLDGRIAVSDLFAAL